MLVSLPFWTSYLLRIYAWKGLLDDHGVVNNFLMSAASHPRTVKMMYTPFSHDRRHGLHLPAVHDPAALRARW